MKKKYQIKMLKKRIKQLEKTVLGLQAIISELHDHDVGHNSRSELMKKVILPLSVTIFASVLVIVFK